MNDGFTVQLSRSSGLRRVHYYITWSAVTAQYGRRMLLYLDSVGPSVCRMHPVWRFHSSNL